MRCTRTLTVSPSASASTSSRTAVPGSSSSREAAKRFGEHHRLELSGRDRRRRRRRRHCRSCRSARARTSTVPASVPTTRRVRALAANSTQVSAPSASQHVLIIVERMAGEEEADRLELARQPIGRDPGLRGAELDRRRFARERRRRDRSGRRSSSSSERLPAAMMRSTLAKAVARSMPSSSRAPAAASVSSARLLTRRGLMRGRNRKRRGRPRASPARRRYARPPGGRHS